MNHAFFAEVRSLFGGALSQNHVDGMKAIQLEKHGDGNRRHLAYARHRGVTAHIMQPIYDRGLRELLPVFGGLS